MKRVKVNGSLLGVVGFYVNLMEGRLRALFSKLKLLKLCMLRHGVFILGLIWLREKVFLA